MTSARYYCRRSWLEVQIATFHARTIAWAAAVILATVAALPLLVLVAFAAPDVPLRLVAAIEAKQARYTAEADDLTAACHALVAEWNADVEAEVARRADALVAEIRRHEGQS